MGGPQARRGARGRRGLAVPPRPPRLWRPNGASLQRPPLPGQQGPSRPHTGSGLAVASGGFCPVPPAGLGPPAAACSLSGRSPPARPGGAGGSPAGLTELSPGRRFPPAASFASSVCRSLHCSLRPTVTFGGEGGGR